MKSTFKYFLSLALVLLALGYEVQAQIVSLSPATATINDSITLTYDATQGNRTLVGSTQVYIHIGLINCDTCTGWTNVQGNWGTADARVRMTSLGNNLWRIGFRIPTFFRVAATANVHRLGMVFRNATGSTVGRTFNGGDIFVNIFQPLEFGVIISSPGGGNQLTAFNQTINISAQSTSNATIRVLANGSEIGSASNVTTFSTPYTISSYGKTRIKVIASNGTQTVADSFYCFTRPQVTVADIPAGMEDGINYSADGTSATLVLYAPFKNHVFILGEFNNWERTTEQYMNRTPDGNRFWGTINGLTSGREYAFQYLVDSTIRIADPYCEIVLDESNDQYINSVTNTYPNLKPYPRNRASGYCGILQPNRPAYNWRNTTFTRPAKTDLVVYELHIRDFIRNMNYRTLTDSLKYLKRLGVNCIELMPINEFEGNLSWGYNPSFHYALDKAYGTREALMAFVDSCHSAGIAVVADVVFNHAFGQSPLAQLWWDAANSRPAANSPYFNIEARHPFNVGNDFNHQSLATQLYMDKCLKHMLQDFKLDGFRYDLSKGFTQVNSGTNVGTWGNYDASRIALLKRMYDKIRTYDNSAYLILEHFADNSEEVALANYGFMLWGNMNNAYLQSAMGYQESSSISWGIYNNRGFSQPNLVDFMESHDEERLMYKAITYGNFSGNYNTRSRTTALDRSKLAAAFFFTVPGPKMMWQFGELGYDYSINYCTDGTINENCRTGQKPLRYDYLRDQNRVNTFKTYSALIKMKQMYNVFRVNNPQLFESGDIKRIKLDDGTTKVVVIGNFGVTTQTINPAFHQTGRWYNFFAGDSTDISNTNAGISLSPGEFRIYSTTRFFQPQGNILISGVSEQLGSNTNLIAADVYPNPVANELYIEVKTSMPETIQCELINSIGQIVSTQNISVNNAGNHILELDLAKQISIGQYLLKIKTQNGQVIRRFVKN